MIPLRFYLVMLVCLAAPVGDLLAQQTTQSERREQMIDRIDQLLADGRQQAGVSPAPIAADGEFLRRVQLDLTGVIPRVAEVRRFLADAAPDKRPALIEQLLASPAHPTHLAAVWRNIMLPQGFDAEQLNSAAGLEGWFRQQFVSNLRYDRIVSEFLVSQGSGQTGPSLFYTSLELQPERLAASTSRIFLGMQIECAQCHDHPFDHWKQRDFWGYAAFFARLKQTNQQMLVSLEESLQGEVTLPDSDEVVPPKYPGGRLADESEGGTRRSQLSIWMASRDNPFLARAAVNRAWSQLFGRGLVEPVDDLGPGNPPSHPELLDELSDYFAQSGFDLRELYRTLANTTAYQRSSRTTEDSPAAPELFARMAVKTLSAEQLFDSLGRLLVHRGPASIPGTTATSRLFDPRRLAFVAQMRSLNPSPSVYEAGVPQALTLLNGVEVAEATDLQRSGLLAALDAPYFELSQRIDIIYLSTYSRFPSADERVMLEQYVIDAEHAPSALSDILWAVLNSAEFTLNH